MKNGLPRPKGLAMSLCYVIARKLHDDMGNDK